LLNCGARVVCPAGNQLNMVVRQPPFEGYGLLSVLDLDRRRECAHVIEDPKVDASLQL
jgi:hypothetical protein